MWLLWLGYFHSGLKGGLIAFNACLEVSSPEDILETRTKNTKKLKKFYDKVENKIEEIMKSWKTKSKIIENKNLIILKFSTKISIQSPIATKIGLENHHYTIIVARDSGNRTYISLRRNDGKVDCSKLAEISTKNLKNSSGGGHTPAAGAHIMRKDWNKFIEKIISLA